MDIRCLGLNHRTAPIEVRERFWFSNEEVTTVLELLKTQHVKEAVLVSTCNRTELYYVADGDVPVPALIGIISSVKQKDAPVDRSYFYTISSLHAANHLFKLASGVDSMVLGDIQILNQIKTAFALAHDTGSSGLILNRLFNNAIHTGKRSRSETEISRGAISVGYAAAELASKIFQDLSGKTALLIGAGETGALTAKHLSGQGLGKLILTNRTREKAEALLSDLPGVVVDFDRLLAVLPEVDIVISSIASNAYVLTSAQILAAVKSRRNRPLFLIDLGMPRNIDPVAGTFGNIFLHNIDDLFHIVDKNLENRRAELPKINAIILRELKEFDGWYNSLQINPTIEQLRSRFEEIRRTEVERYAHKFSGDSREDIELVTKRIINKLLHVPTTNLRKSTAGGDADESLQTLNLLRSLFDLKSKIPQ